MRKYLIAATLGWLLPLSAFAAFDTNLKYGDSGAKVVALQTFLIGQGVLNHEPTGNFYALTQLAVRKFQVKVGVTPPTGFFGALTRAKANSLLSMPVSDTKANLSAPTTTSTSTSAYAYTYTLPDGSLVGVNASGQATYIHRAPDVSTTTSTTVPTSLSPLILPAGCLKTISGYISCPPTSSVNSVPSTNAPTTIVPLLTATKSTGYGDQVFSAGATNVHIATFYLNAGTSEGINVNSIAIGFSSDVSATITNLTLIGGFGVTPKTNIGLNNLFPESFFLSANIFIEVYADIKSNADPGIIGGQDGMTLLNVTGTGYASGSPVQIASPIILQNIAVSK